MSSVPQAPIQWSQHILPVMPPILPVLLQHISDKNFRQKTILIHYNLFSNFYQFQTYVRTWIKKYLIKLS